MVSTLKMDVEDERVGGEEEQSLPEIESSPPPGEATETTIITMMRIITIIIITTPARWMRDERVRARRRGNGKKERPLDP